MEIYTTVQATYSNSQLLARPRSQEEESFSASPFSIHNEEGYTTKAHMGVKNWSRDKHVKPIKLTSPAHIHYFAGSSPAMQYGG